MIDAFCAQFIEEGRVHSLPSCVDSDSWLCNWWRILTIEQKCTELMNAMIEEAIPFFIKNTKQAGLTGWWQLVALREPTRSRSISSFLQHPDVFNKVIALEWCLWRRFVGDFGGDEAIYQNSIWLYWNQNDGWLIGSLPSGRNRYLYWFRAWGNKMDFIFSTNWKKPLWSQKIFCMVRAEWGTWCCPRLGMVAQTNAILPRPMHLIKRRRPLARYFTILPTKLPTIYNWIG